ncbi:MAG: IMS domain-containing protein [Cyanobacteria bacterium P01_F01_bin.150]
MHIPLDYYRVLGLPIQATAEQLNHAHRDRALQLPRREFSEWAIAARRQLIDEAYEILNDPNQRQPYDASFLSKPFDMGLESEGVSTPLDGIDASFGDDPNTVKQDASPAPIPTIEIHDNQFIGALLLLYELGEYELVLKLGRPYLSSGEKNLATGQFGDPQIVGADIVLTIALSCLELGREQWQQGQYEAAAESLETGQELLLREGLFPGVRGEIQSDLYKLRPYRILELLALPAEREAERYNGLRLLQDILQDRGGIDGKGNDQSGLSTDDFLRFIQQLRSYLTVSEQQQIFGTEANRPSAVATYLAVYAFIAGGFAHRQPSLIGEAKHLLSRLGNRQDVKLEQAVCSLLFGQTEDANRLVEQSQEMQTLSYIRKHSEGAPDLLPGLCLYAEQWLRAEVFPQFRDLEQEDASLKGYFADRDVQAYLESLPAEDAQTALATSSNTAMPNGAVAYDNGYNRQEASSAYKGHRAAVVGATAVGAVGATATRMRADSARHGSGQTTTLQPAERVSTSSPEGHLSRPIMDADANGNDFQPPQLANVPQGTVITPRGRIQAGPRIDRLLLLAALGILGLLIMWMIASRISNQIGIWLGGSEKSLLPGEQLELKLNQSVVSIPSPAASSSNVAEGELNAQGAESVIRAWLEAKKAAMGPDYDRSFLEDVLVGDLLVRWQGESKLAEQDGYHRTYDHPSLTIDDVTWSEDAPDSASISVSITETSEFYAGERQDINKFYDSSLNVVYGVVQEDGRWKIKSNSIQ